LEHDETIPHNSEDWKETLLKHARKADGKLLKSGVRGDLGG
jgi:hypothetical protein